MPLQTFTPSIAPSPGTSFKPKVSLWEAEFGDGYSQTAPRGLNHIRNMISLKWDGLIETQMLEIRTFFEDHGGFRPFWYLPRGRSEPQKFVCKDWNVTGETPWQIEAKLEQVFVNEV